MASFSLLLVSVFAIVATSFASAFSPDNISVTCNANSWWAIFSLDKTTVDPWVPSRFPFASSLPAAFSTLPSNQRVVTLEFNHPEDCYTQLLPSIKTTFTEFKVHVPYLNAQRFTNTAPLMWKPIIYVDNWINAEASKLQYGLITKFTSSMNADYTNNKYTVQYNGKSITGTFTPRSDWMSFDSLPANSLAREYKPMHDSSEWLGHDVFQRDRCAKHYHAWSQAQVRFVDAIIDFDADMVQSGSAAFSKNIVGTSQFATAIQIRVLYNITGLDKCSGQN